MLCKIAHHCSFRVVRASRVLVLASGQSALLLCERPVCAHLCYFAAFLESTLRRDAATGTRDACATRSAWARGSFSSYRPFAARKTRQEPHPLRRIKRPRSRSSSQLPAPAFHLISCLRA